MAPEVYRNEEYDTKVDVFSFALILQEVNVIFPEMSKITCIFDLYFEMQLSAFLV